MNKAIILGSGAAAGVPTISDGWGVCRPDNPKNRRRRAGIYVEIDGSKIQIDTSADFREQMIDNNIRTFDAVLYTHAHADHLMGIDDLRAINYSMNALYQNEPDFKMRTLDIYAAPEHLAEIRHRFGYVMADSTVAERTHRPLLAAHAITAGTPFNIGKVEIMPLNFAGHPVPTTGYVFNRGQLVVVPDYKIMPPPTLEYLQNIDVNVLIMPLTSLSTCGYHANIEIDLDYVQKIRPRRVVLTHMSGECDYDEVARLTPANVEPGFDNMVIEL